MLLPTVFPMRFKTISCRNTATTVAMANTVNVIMAFSASRMVNIEDRFSVSPMQGIIAFLKRTGQGVRDVVSCSPSVLRRSCRWVNRQSIILGSGQQLAIGGQ